MRRPGRATGCRAGRARWSSGRRVVLDKNPLVCTLALLKPTGLSFLYGLLRRTTH